MLLSENAVYETTGLDLWVEDRALRWLSLLGDDVHNCKLPCSRVQMPPAWPQAHMLHQMETTVPVLLNDYRQRM